MSIKCVVPLSKSIEYSAVSPEQFLIGPELLWPFILCVSIMVDISIHSLQSSKHMLVTKGLAR